MAKKGKSKPSADESSAIEEIVSFHPKDMDSFYAWDDDFLVLNILGTPSAKRNLIGKPLGNQLKISVTATPVDGRATDYMVKWLAKEFGVKKSAIDVVFGRMSIHKQLRVKSPARLPEIIEKMEMKGGR